MSRIFIHAANVHVGGGRELLHALLASDWVKSRDVTLLADARMPLPEIMPESLTVRRVQPAIGDRLAAEKWIKKNVLATDSLLCFGNLPPLMKSSGNVVVFLQNRYLLGGSSLNGFPLKVRLRLSIERFWFRKFAGNADRFVVQTPSMRSALLSSFPASSDSSMPRVEVVPFIKELKGFRRSVRNTVNIPRGEKCTFFYVASGEPHKNHRRLIEAWVILASENIFPRLLLTVDEQRFPDLAELVRLAKENCSVDIDNRGALPRADVDKLYCRSDALINPSTFESFGLPLIEARQEGLPVLASELDYVRDILDPEETFDPYSSTSIARAVKRFLGLQAMPLELVDASAFLAKVFTTSRN